MKAGHPLLKLFALGYLLVLVWVGAHPDVLRPSEVVGGTCGRNCQSSSPNPCFGVCKDAPKFCSCNSDVYVGCTKYQDVCPTFGALCSSGPDNFGYNCKCTINNFCP